MMWICPNCGKNIHCGKKDTVTCSCGERKSPNFLEKISKFSYAAIKHLLAGNPTCTQEQIDKRIDTCKKCSYFNGVRCSQCGCNCNSQQKYLNKLAWADQKCPKDYWLEISMEYITLEQFTRDIFKLSQLVPKDVIGVVGVARSGMIVASQLASHLHLPLYTYPDTICKGGFRYDEPTWKGRLLLVDDTVCSGRTLPKYDLPGAYKAVVYCAPNRTDLVDFYVKQLVPPHYLEWNIFNSFYNVAFDLDGVICEDEDYTKPLYLPRKGKITIITSRYESEREETLAWLTEHHITIDEMYMHGEGERNDLQEYKGNILKKIKPELFIESCPILAKQLSHICPVLCPKESKIYDSFSK